MTFSRRTKLFPVCTPRDASLCATILIRDGKSFVDAVARRLPIPATLALSLLSFVNAKRKKEKKKGRRRQIDVRASATPKRVSRKYHDPEAESPNVKLSVRNLHCCVSLSRVGRRGRHIPGAEAGRRDPGKLDKLTTYASHSRTSPLRCSTFVSEGLLPSLFLVHLW